jgi:putative oxidoreductase
MNFGKYLFGLKPLTQYYILVLRVIMGLFFINHGGHELFDAKAMDELVNYFEMDLHFPKPLFMAYLRTIAEFFGGVMLVLGLFTRLGALLIMITMLVAGFTAGKLQLFGIGEMDFAYAAVMLTLFLAGPSKFSVDFLMLKKLKNQY